MKRKYIIILLWCLWACSLIVATICIFNHINNKSNKLHTELRENIIELFDGQFGELLDGFFCKSYSNEPVRNIIMIDIPEQPRFGASYFANEKWKNRYGDLASLYELNWKCDHYPCQYDDGWNIGRICCGYDDDDIIKTSVIFPYQVGIIRNERYNQYSIEEAINDAFIFYSSDTNSPLADRFRDWSYFGIWSKIFDCCNRYYGIVENKDYSGWLNGTPISHVETENAVIPWGATEEEWEQWSNAKEAENQAQRLSPVDAGSIDLGCYRVCIATTQEKHYMIKEKERVVKEDRNKLLIWWGIGLSILFFSLIIPLTIVEKKSKKRKSETLYQRLCRLCNPKEFMQNYDKDKVDKANSIYKRLMETKLDDKETLMEIQDIAVSELGITLIDMEEVKELKEKVNPKRFLNPYNAEKVALANELYAILSKEGLTYNEFIEAEERAKTLL